MVSTENSGSASSNNPPKTRETFDSLNVETDQEITQQFEKRKQTRPLLTIILLKAVSFVF